MNNRNEQTVKHPGLLNEDLDGPAFIEKAKQALNQTPPNYIEAINYYSKAITTKNNPQEKDGMEGIQATMKQLDPNTLKTPEVMKILIMNGIILKFQSSKKDSYKEYCKMNLMPKNILSEIIMGSNGVTLFIKNFFGVLVGANTYLSDNHSAFVNFFMEGPTLEKSVIPPNEKDSIIQTAEAILRNLLTLNLINNTFKTKILVALALLQPNPIESLEFNDAIQIGALNINPLNIHDSKNALKNEEYNTKIIIKKFLNDIRNDTRKEAIGKKEAKHLKEAIKHLLDNENKWPTIKWPPINNSNPQIKPELTREQEIKIETFKKAVQEEQNPNVTSLAKQGFYQYINISPVSKENDQILDDEKIFKL